MSNRPAKTQAQAIRDMLNSETARKIHRERTDIVKQMLECQRKFYESTPRHMSHVRGRRIG
jgi:hypothetical protein